MFIVELLARRAEDHVNLAGDTSGDGGDSVVCAVGSDGDFDGDL